MTRAAESYARGFARGLEVEPDLTVSEWADAHRKLTSRSSAFVGQWQTDRFPFLRAIMDDLSASSPVERVVVSSGRQIGKTETALNWVGYVIHHAPGPMLIVEPTVEMGKKASKQRIAPMIEESAELKSRVKPARSRDSGNTLSVKEFDGGILMIAGANSSAALRGMPVRYLMCEELDTWKDEQGDALSIAISCTKNFPNRKICMLGNPTIDGASRIHREFLKGDQRRYFVPCPRCGHRDFLTWSGFANFVAKTDAGHHRIAFSRDDEGRVLEAWMVCGSCGERVDEPEKRAMFAAGEWRPTAAGDGATRSYHLSSLYSPFGFYSWLECARTFVAAGKDPIQLRAFVNEDLGEVWQMELERVDAAVLMQRIERYPEEVPAGVGILTAGVDVQGNRLEVVVWGFGAEEESWLIAWQAIAGDPAKPQVWADLDAFLRQDFTHESGRKLKIECACVDSGGHHAEQVYRFCAARVDRRIFASKGDGNSRGLPIVGKPSTSNRYRTPLFLLCVDTAKGMLAARLRMAKPAPGDTRGGYVHLPEWFEQDLAEQLTAEQAIFKYSGGKRVRHWEEKHPGQPNEQLDCAVYALAALYILGQAKIKSLGELATRWSAPLEPNVAAPAEPDRMQVPPQLLRPMRPRGWVGGWRR